MNPAESHAALLQRFEQRQIDPVAFAHRDHVMVAFQILDKYEFLEACSQYARVIRGMAEDAGAPEKYNATITIAFMSLIAERKSRMPGADLESFVSGNSDLFDRNVLSRWYSAGRLGSVAARGQFLLPDKTQEL